MTAAQTLRRRVAGVAMIVAPTLLLIVTTIAPENSADGAEQLRVVIDHSDLWLVSDGLSMVALVLLVPSIFGLMHMLRERSPRFAHIGGAMALTGVVAVSAQTFLGLVEWQMTRGDHTDAVQMAALLDRIEGDWTTAIVLLSAVFLTLGLATLAIGLWRAKVVAALPALALAVGAILINAGFELPSGELTFAATALTFAGLAAIGWRVLSGPEEVWAGV